MQRVIANCDLPVRNSPWHSVMAVKMTVVLTSNQGKRNDETGRKHCYYWERRTERNRSETPWLSIPPPRTLSSSEQPVVMCTTFFLCACIINSGNKTGTSFNGVVRDKCNGVSALAPAAVRR